MHGTGIKVNRQINQVFRFAGTQARRSHVVHLQFQNLGRHKFFRQDHQTVPDRLCRFDRNLLPHDAARQGGKGVAPGLQGQVAQLRNEPLHDPVFFDQVLAGLVPVFRG